MKTKLITALLAFSTTFGASAAVSRLFETPRSAQTEFAQKVDRSKRAKILLLLQQDIQNGEQLNFQVFALEDQSRPPQSAAELAKYTEFINEYVEKSESIDDSDLSTLR